MKKIKLPNIKNKRTLILVILLILISLVIRIIYINQLKDNPFFDQPVLDSLTYHQMAVKIAEGEHPTNSAFYQPPLYPYFVGFFYRLYKVDISALRFFQMLLGVVNVLLLFFLVKRLISETLAFIAALTMALYGPMLYFEGEILAPVLIILFNLLMMTSLFRFLKKKTWIRASLTGIFLGLSAITMTIIIPFAFILLLFYYFYERKAQAKLNKARFFTMSSCFILGFIFIIAPVTYSNLKKGGEFILISNNGGINFYLGSGPNFQEKVNIRPGLKWNAMMQEPLDAGFKSAKERSRYFFKKGFKIVLNNPLGYIGIMIKKIFLFANGNEIMRNQELYPFRKFSSLFSILVWKHGIAFPFGILFPLAFLGAIFAVLYKKSDFNPIILFVISHILVLTLFFITSRYRMNILPFLIILAVYGGAQLVQLFKGKSFKHFFGGLALFILLLIGCNLQVGKMAEDFKADTYFNLGVNHLDIDKSQAKEYFLKSISIDPDFAEANGNLGLLQNIEGNYDGALAYFNKILKKYPDDITALNNSGISHFKKGDFKKAEEFFLKVIGLEKDNKLALNYLAGIEVEIKHQQAKNLDNFILEVQRSLQKNPYNAELLSNLGMAYIMKKDFSRAIEILQRAVKIAPNDPQVHNNLGIAFASVNRFAEARREFQRAIKLDPDFELPRKNLKKLNQ